MRSDVAVLQLYVAAPARTSAASSLFSTHPLDPKTEGIAIYCYDAHRIIAHGRFLLREGTKVQRPTAIFMPKDLDIFANPPTGPPNPQSPKPPPAKKYPKTPILGESPRVNLISPKVNVISPKVNVISPKVNVKYF